MDNAGGTATFTIERKTGTTGTYAPIATTATGTTTYADSTVVVGTTYCYRVKASSAVGDSGYSNDACGSPGAGLDFTVARAGTGSGTVVSSPPGIDCGGNCVTSFSAGKVVTLRATAARGSFFSGWSGGGCSGTAPCVIAGNTPVTVTATFTLDSTAPTAGITSPSSGAALSGSVSVAVKATDNVAVTRVELWVDGALVTTGATASGSLTWDSTTKPNGVHSLIAKAYDAAGNVAASTPISVTVNNSRMAPTSAMTLAFTGKTRDRVGQSITVFAPDGALDGTFVLTLAPGAGPRTITQLELRRTGPLGVWDTDPMSAFWVLGVAGSLDGPLLNTSDGAVSVTLPESGAAVLFAADLVDLFSPGSVFSLTATFADGTTASASTTIVATPALTLAFIGPVRDRVGQGNTALAPDGALDGTLTATLSASGGRTVTGLRLDSNAPGTWDTTSGTGFWVLAVAPTLDGTLLNAPGTLAVNFPVADGGSFVLFASDYQNAEFLPGRTLTLTATFADGSTATAVTTVPATLNLAYNGKLRDRVGQGDTALSPDGSLDGTLTATLSAPGGRTITGLRLDSDAPGIWDTRSGNEWWVLGVATTLDGVLLNAPGSMAVNFPVADGGSFVMFASDHQAGEFLPGRTLTLTATFADGSTATAVTTVP